MTDYSRLHCLYVFDRDGNCLRKLGGEGEELGQFAFPAGVCYLNSNEILITDQYNHRIQRINIQTGTVVESLGKCGIGRGEFENPVDVCLDECGQIVVTELGNHRIQVSSEDGVAQFIFGDNGPGELHFPLSCIPLKNKFLVSDNGNSCIKAFDRSGTFLYKFGKASNRDGQFNCPSGILVDSFNNLLVCDRDNNRVQRFSLDGRFKGKTDLPRPARIATAPDGRILMTAPKTVYTLK